MSGPNGEWLAPDDDLAKQVAAGNEEQYFSEHHRVPGTDIQYRFKVGSFFTYFSRVDSPEKELAITTDELTQYLLERVRRNDFSRRLNG